MSHPVISGKGAFTAFRGSLQIQSGQQLHEVHVGLRSGESLAISDLRLRPDRVLPIRVSLVYPADATPGHLLSVVPVHQLAQLHQRQQDVKRAKLSIANTVNRQLTLPAPPPKAEPSSAVNRVRPVPIPAMVLSLIHI